MENNFSSLHQNNEPSSDEKFILDINAGIESNLGNVQLGENDLASTMSISRVHISKITRYNREEYKSVYPGIQAATSNRIAGERCGYCV